MFEFVIYRPLGFIIEQIYSLVQNYGWAIIIFTIIVKLILLPLNIKSQKAMKKQQKIQPILMELQKKYANDKEKLQTETMKVYKENNISMMGGCLPLLIQFPILIGLYRVIQSPIKYLLGVDFNLTETMDKVSTLFEAMKTQFPDAVSNLLKLSPEQIAKSYQMQLSNWSAKVGNGEWAIDFGFFGLDLSRNPGEAISAVMKGNFADLATVLLILIPILAMLTTWLSMWQSQKMAPQQSGDASAAQMSKGMNAVMPLMSGFFAISLPAGLGIYWIAANLFQMAQQYFLNLYFNKKEDDFVVRVPGKNRKKGKKRK